MQMVENRMVIGDYYTEPSRIETCPSCGREWVYCDAWEQWECDDSTLATRDDPVSHGHCLECLVENATRKQALDWIREESLEVDVMRTSMLNTGDPAWTDTWRRCWELLASSEDEADQQTVDELIENYFCRNRFDKQDFAEWLMAQ